VLDYIRAAYWTITTLATVGYGDITAETKGQMIYASLTMLVGIGFFGYVLGNIASLLVRLDAAREAHLEILSRVDSFMRGNAVPGPLRSRVREYYRYVWKSHQGYDVSAILDELPPKLRADVALFLNAEMIEKVPILKGADRRLLEGLVIELKPRVIIPQEELFCAGDPGDGMYFILRGAIEIVTADGAVLATLGPGSFFGEAALVTARPRNATARAAGYGDVFFLKREAFERVLSHNPGFRQQVNAIAATRTGNTSSPLPPA
jgi:voltage-gated potassium channel